MDLRRALLRQRYFKAHPRDTLTPEIWEVLARFYPSSLKMMDNTTLEVINALVSLSLSDLASAETHWKTRTAGKEPRQWSALFFTGSHASLIHTIGSSPVCLWWSCRKETRGGSGSRAQHPSKMHKGRQVLHVQAPRCPGRFYGRDAQIRNAAKEETQNAPEAAHYNQHAHTILRAPGGGDWRITKGTRQGEFGCDISLEDYDIPLKKYVICRQQTSEMMSLEGHRIDVSLLTFVDDLMNILIESTPGAMNLRDRANDKNLTHELGKVGCELESSKEECLIRWMRSNARKHLAKFRSRKLLGPGRFPQTVRHFWMLARNVRRGRHNGQAKDHGYAHQLLQICRSMEVQTRFFSDQEDSFSNQ